MGATSLLTRSVHEYGPERTTCKSMAMHKRLRPPMVRDVSRAKALVYAFVATLVIIGCCSMPVFAFNVGMHPRVDSFQICVPSFHDAHPCWGKRCPRHSRLSPAFAAPRPAESSVGESGDGSIPVIEMLVLNVCVNTQRRGYSIQPFRSKDRVHIYDLSSALVSRMGKKIRKLDFQEVQVLVYSRCECCVHQIACLHTYQT